MGGTSFGMEPDPKDALVQKIKAYQRQVPDAKAVWESFCDANMGGMYDPARHDLASLQMFVDTNGLQNASFGIAAPSNDPLRNELVDKIKSYQRMGDAQKENWHLFCDTNMQGKRDPSRASVDSLQTFVAAYGL